MKISMLKNNRFILVVGLTVFLSFFFSDLALSQSNKIAEQRLQQRVQEAKEKIRRARTDELARKIGDIPKKEQLTDEEVRRITTIQKQFSRESKANVTRDGWIQVPYGETPTLSCGVNGYCVVALEPGERPVETDVSDREAWEVDGGLFGPNGLLPYISFKAIYADSYAQVNIFTDKGRVYTLFLISKAYVFREDGTAPIHSMKLRYSYPKNTELDLNKFNVAGSSSVIPSENEIRRLIEGVDQANETSKVISPNLSSTTGKSLDHLDKNTNYIIRYVGQGRDSSPDWKPVRAYADHKSGTTVIELPIGLVTFPNFYVVGEDGKQLVTGGDIVGTYGNIVAINGLHDKVLVQSGAKDSSHKVYEAVRL